MDQAGPAGIALGLALFSLAFQWVARNGKFWKAQAFGVWIFSALAAMMAIGVGFALSHTWLGSTALERLSHVLVYGRPWPAWLMGLIALALPIILFIALIPAWPLAVSEALLIPLMFAEPLRTWAWTSGATGAFGGTVRDLILELAHSIAGGA